VAKERNPIYFLADDAQAPIHSNGTELRPGTILVSSPGAEHHRRSASSLRWASMSLTPDDLAAASLAIVGRELNAPATTSFVQPPHELMSRLVRLHAAAGHLAATAPDVLAHPEVARAMEHELISTLVSCLAAVTTEASNHPRVPVMQRFERFLTANPAKPVYISEICADIGVSTRTLRLHCSERLGMSPHRYLILRRMHQVRRVLVRSDPRSTTVTGVATNHGFWELGRFSVAYRRLFGETPSTTLRRVEE
jgi:AraC-like DNA-binding protein